MKKLHIDITCPICHTTIHIPFLPALEAKALEDYDLAEQSAQEELSNLHLWLGSASLISLTGFWLQRRKKK